jgi:acetyltransferase-like isoleucine patch superfamily enzyme
MIHEIEPSSTRTSINHDCHVGEGTHIAPAAAIAANVRIGGLAFIGTGSVAIPDTTIGEGAVIGAGACGARHTAPRLQSGFRHAMVPDV